MMKDEGKRYLHSWKVSWKPHISLARTANCPAAKEGDVVSISAGCFAALEKKQTKTKNKVQLVTAEKEYQ